jgi:hypothetical protein
MQEFLITLLVVFILFRVFRTIIFRSAYSAFVKHQHDSDRRKEEEELRRKREGQITIEEIKPGKSSRQDDGEYIDYEELK